MMASNNPIFKDAIDLTASDNDSPDVVVITQTHHRSQPQPQAARPQSQPQPQPQAQPQTQPQSQPPQSQLQAQPAPQSRNPISPPPRSQPQNDTFRGEGNSINAAPSVLAVPPQASPSRPIREPNQETPRNPTKANPTPVKPPLLKSTHDPPQSVTPPSAKKHVNHHKTPKSQTPKKVEWSVEKIEEKLRVFAQDIGADSAALTSYLVDTAWKSKSSERRFITKKDHFAGIRLTPAEPSAKPPEVLKMKTKVRYVENILLANDTS